MGFVAFDMVVAYAAFEARLASPVMDEPTAILVTYTLRLLAAILFVMWCVWKRGQTWEDFGVRKSTILSDLFWGLRLLAVTAAVILLTLWLLASERPTSSPALARGEPSGLHTVVVWAEDAFFIPAVEELIYRGILMPPLIARVGTTRAIVLNAAIFCFLHIGPYHGGFYGPGVLVWGLLGLLLGTVFCTRRSVFATILVHGMANAPLILWQRSYHGL